MLRSRLSSVMLAILWASAGASAQTPPPAPDTLVPPIQKALPAIGTQPGQRAPDFKLKTLTGPKATLSDLKGRPVLLSFWATWCPPCRAEMPEIVAAYRAQKEAGLEVVAVNLTDQEWLKDVRKFVTEFEMPFPVLLDERGRVRELYALISVPTYVFIGPDGVVRVVNSGPMSTESLKRGLAQIVPER